MYNNTRFAPVILFMIISALLVSCSVERKLAREFINNKDAASVLMFAPGFLYKSNLKAYEVPDAKTLDKRVLDSVLYNKSIFVQYVSDSIFIETYVNSLIRGLNGRGITVYLPGDSDLFFNNAGDKYIVNLVQVQLEEDIEPAFSDNVEYQSYYLQDIYLNLVRFNAWFEISGVNEQKPKKELAFADISLTDRFEGRLRFFPWVGEFKYVYTFDTIRIRNIYDLSHQAGQRFAGYLTDYFMNRYVDRNLPKVRVREDYLRYDASQRQLRRAESDRFTILE